MWTLCLPKPSLPGSAPHRWLNDIDVVERERGRVGPSVAEARPMARMDVDFLPSWMTVQRMTIPSPSVDVGSVTRKNREPPAAKIGQ